MHKRDKQKRTAFYTKMRAPYLVENTHRGFVLVGRVGAWLRALSLTQDALALAGA